jgi:Transglutaminase-like superfamily
VSGTHLEGVELSGMKLVSKLALSLLLVAIIPSMAASGVKTAKLTDRLVLNVGNDSVVVIYESLRVPFRPADLKAGDTARIVLEDTTGGQAILELIASHDSLGISPIDTAVTVSMITDTDTVFVRTVFIVQKPTSHFLTLLREYDTFDGTTGEKLGDFTYADSNEVSLARMRKDFQLDSVAGAGDEVSRIVNLLHWVHTTVRHDGSIESQPADNEYELLAGALKDNRGVNCGVLAEIANAVYLAMGFSSRRVVCLPYDTLDVDCHSINIVWSRHLGKWLYVDPTFEGLFQDSKSELLSITEVREAMICGESLTITDNLNWNGQPHSKDVYFRYLAKNLFQFNCWSQSGPVGGEQSKPSCWIHLAPTGYLGAQIGRGSTIDTSIAHITRYTDNAVEFWAEP